VHFPTDVNLLWDAGRKSLYLIEDVIREGLLEGKGWRKGKLRWTGLSRPFTINI